MPGGETAPARIFTHEGSPPPTQGSFDVGRGLPEGDRLVLHDSEGRVLIYSLKTGELRHRFFGDTAAVNPRRNQVVVEDFPGEVSLYDLDTGDLKAKVRSAAAAAAPAQAAK